MDLTPLFPSHSVFYTWTTEHRAWTRRLHVLLMVSNSFPVFTLITYWGRGRELRWQDLRSIFLTPMNSSQVGISLPAALYCMYYCVLWEAELGWLASQLLASTSKSLSVFEASSLQGDTFEFLTQSMLSSYFHSCPFSRTNLTIHQVTTLAEIS